MLGVYYLCVCLCPTVAGMRPPMGGPMGPMMMGPGGMRPPMMAGPPQIRP